MKCYWLQMATFFLYSIAFQNIDQFTKMQNKNSSYDKKKGRVKRWLMQNR